MYSCIIKLLVFFIATSVHIRSKQSLLCKTFFFTKQADPWLTKTRVLTNQGSLYHVNFTLSAFYPCACKRKTVALLHARMDYDHHAFVDDLFLPSLFTIFTSGLVTVLHSCCFVKQLKMSLPWRGTMMLLLSLSVTAFILQATCSWKKDFLHQVGLIQTPVLWQRVLSSFIMVGRKLCTFLYYIFARDDM